mgnify:CR=1 FL=1
MEQSNKTGIIKLKNSENPIIYKPLVKWIKHEEPELHLDFREVAEDSRVRFRVNQDDEVQIFEVVLALVQEPSAHWEFKGLELQTLKQEEED